MSGRGRGINNAPAWMDRGGRPGSGPGPNGHDREGFGRNSRGPPQQPPRDRGFPPPHHRNDRGGPSRPHGRHGGGGPPGRFHQGPPPSHHSGGPRGGGPPHDRRGGPAPPPRPRPNRPDSNGNQVITFRSYEEERDWVEERRRKRMEREIKFDKEPTAEQLATDAAASAFSNPAATDFAGISADRDFAAVPQQTRHARRLYIGHLPADVTEDELHVFFRDAIEKAVVVPLPPGEDPVLSVYINHERRFCFLEFRTVEMATACLALDGINISGKGKVKVKRPNDYNPTMAPKVHPSAIPELDVSKLGIISGTVEDSQNKVFVGGLHYHLTEPQVLELLQAFGKIKAFHLVKNEPDSNTSKGYCFVEYADAEVTKVAVLGLNGMDLGGGKSLTARVAAGRNSSNRADEAAHISAMAQQALASAVGAIPGPGTATEVNPMIISGYDIDELVNAAAELRPMPTGPTHVDSFGVPITRTLPSTVLPGASGATAPKVPIVTIPAPPPMSAPISMPLPTPVHHNLQPPMPPMPLPGGAASALDIANAALDAAFGSNATVPPPPPPPPAPIAPPAAPSSSSPSRILVLQNMVTDEDLETEEECEGLKEEVEGECAKFGKLLGIKIPRTTDANVAVSAIRKVFLEYATVQDATMAEKELAGRQFGPSVVETSYLREEDYSAGRLY